MKTLYSSVEINRVLDDFKEIRKYYITKEDSYGFVVTKTASGELVEKEVLCINNIVDDEEKIKLLIEEVIRCENDFEQAKYVVEDSIKAISKKEKV